MQLTCFTRRQWRKMVAEFGHDATGRQQAQDCPRWHWVLVARDHEGNVLDVAFVRAGYTATQRAAVKAGYEAGVRAVSQRAA